MEEMTSYTFARFLRSPETEAFVRNLDRPPQMPAMRYVYLYCLCKRSLVKLASVTLSPR